MEHTPETLAHAIGDCTYEEAQVMLAAPALLEALWRARNWMGAGGEWQDADASGRRVEIEQDINCQSSAAIEAAKGD